MNRFGFLAPAVFDLNRRAVFEEVDHIKSDASLTKGRRLAGVRTLCGGEVVAEILETSLGPVVVYRTDTGELNPDDDSYRPWRQDRRRVIEALTGDPNQTFDVMDKHGMRFRLKATDFDSRTFTFRGHSARLKFL